MYFETDNEMGYLFIYLDDGETLENEAQVLEQMAYSIDITFGELQNEGYPEYLGNDCAEYVFTLFIDGKEWLFGFSNFDFEELTRNGEIKLFTKGRRDSVLLRYETPTFGPCNVLFDDGEYIFVYRNRNNEKEWFEGKPCKPSATGDDNFILFDFCELDEDYINALEWAESEIASKIVHMMEAIYGD